MKKKLLTAVIGLMLAIPAGLMAAEMAVYKEESQFGGPMDAHGANGSVDVKLMNPMKDKMRSHVSMKGTFLGHAMEGSEVKVTWANFDNANDPITLLWNVISRPNEMMIKLKPGKYDLKGKKNDKMFGRIVIEEVKGKDNVLMVRFEPMHKDMKHDMKGDMKGDTMHSNGKAMKK